MVGAYRTTRAFSGDGVSAIIGACVPTPLSGSPGDDRGAGAAHLAIIHQPAAERRQVLSPYFLRTVPNDVFQTLAM